MQVPDSVAVFQELLFDLSLVRCVIESLDEYPVRSLVLWLECASCVCLLFWATSSSLISGLLFIVGVVVVIVFFLSARQ